MLNSTSESNFTVLSAEDDEDYFHLLNMILSQELKVDTVNHVVDGDELVKSLTQPHNKNPSWPELILLDLNMPKKNGIEALTEIRANPNIPKIPIVMFTISDDLNDIQACYDKGANAFISKPTNLNDLIETLGSAIKFWKNLKKNTLVGV